MAIAARTLRHPELGESATRARGLRRAPLWGAAPQLAPREGEPGAAPSPLPAYLDDYAYLADAILELLQWRWRSEDFTFVLQLVDALQQHFADRVHGGFFFTADDHERLMHRSKSFGDDATPSGNAVAAFVLNRLGLLLGSTEYLAAAERTLRAGWGPLERYPQGHATMLNALDEFLRPGSVVIIRGAREEAERWRDELAALYAPRRMIFAIPDDAADLPAALADKKPLGRTAAYVCRGMTCSAPIESLESLVVEMRTPPAR
jgi:uncharacterized protein YyaL (SSP411 family)